VSARKRIEEQPAWILHHRPFRDSSRILDILSRDYGRLSLVSRGSRAPRSRLAGILRPFMPLRLSWVIRSDLGTLTGAEMQDAPVSLSGDALLCGYYVNELLLYMLHRHDPQPDIFSVYGDTVKRLAGRIEVASVLRRFEIELLRMLGYALNFDRDTGSEASLRPELQYEYRVEQGPVFVAERDGPMIFTGAELAAIQRQDFAKPAVLKNAGRLLRGVIAYHLEGRELRSRKVMKELMRARESQDLQDI
jgi:DNA repair protein RecO (recombination protein O)